MLSDLRIYSDTMLNMCLSTVDSESTFSVCWHFQQAESSCIGLLRRFCNISQNFVDSFSIYRVSTEYLQYLVSPPPCLRVVAAAGWSQRRLDSGVMKPSFLGPRLTNLNLINALPSSTSSSRPARVSVVTEETKRCAAGTQNRVSQ